MGAKRKPMPPPSTMRSGREGRDGGQRPDEVVQERGDDAGTRLEALLRPRGRRPRDRRCRPASRWARTGAARSRPRAWCALPGGYGSNPSSPARPPTRGGGADDHEAEPQAGADAHVHEVVRRRGRACCQLAEVAALTSLSTVSGTTEGGIEPVEEAVGLERRQVGGDGDRRRAWSTTPGVPIATFRMRPARHGPRFARRRRCRRAEPRARRPNPPRWLATVAHNDGTVEVGQHRPRGGAADVDPDHDRRAPLNATRRPGRPLATACRGRAPRPAEAPAGSRRWSTPSAC
jgi:hypothetical protein